MDIKKDKSKAPTSTAGAGVTEDAKNLRETGARALKEAVRPDPQDNVSQEAAENEKPASGMGLTRKLGEVDAKTRQSDDRNPHKSRK